MNWRSTTGRTAQIVIGVVFLAAGALKAWEPALFYWNIASYIDLLTGFVQDPWKQYLIKDWQILSFAGLLIIPLEVALGAALVCNWRPRPILLLASALMLAFVLMMVGAWSAGSTSSCGCFGYLIERTPDQAIVEDLILLCVLQLGWLAVRERPLSRFSGLIMTLLVVVSFALGGTRLISQPERLGDSDLRPGVRLTGLQPTAIDADLMKGNVLLEFISPVCSHCGASVSLMNAYQQQFPSLQIIALTSSAQNTPELHYFRDWWHPHFPIGTISQMDFLRLTHGHTTPRLALVHNGVIQSVWERDGFPDSNQLSTLLTAPKPQH